MCAPFREIDNNGKEKRRIPFCLLKRWDWKTYLHIGEEEEEVRRNESEIISNLVTVISDDTS